MFVLRADGKAVQLAKNALDPAWAPDGRTLSFERGGAIYLVDERGGAARELTEGDDAAWSPDGTTIVFAFGPAIWTVRTDGTAKRQVSGSFPFDPNCEETLEADSPGWSPDRSKVAYSVENSPSCVDRSLYVTKADGSSPVVMDAGITPFDEVPARPSWSPDGSRVLFGGVDGVVVAAADGSARNMLSIGKAPSWSPDGSKILFTRERCQCGGRPLTDIWLMSADGSGKLRLVTGALNLEPTWRPAAH